MLSSLDVGRSLPISKFSRSYRNTLHRPDWMNEGGQSSTGQLLDFMIDTHPASERLSALAKERGMNRFDVLTDLLKTMAKERGVEFLSLLTKDMYVYPDLHGMFPLLSGSND